jgi:type IV pilus assembly protein PilQ
VFPAKVKQNEKAEPLANSLTDFKIDSTPNTTTITLISNTVIKDYRVDTIGGSGNRPPRMYIDINNININELVREKLIGTSVDKIRVAPRGKGARIVFDSASPSLFKYSVAPTKDGLAVVIDESAAAVPASASTVSQNATVSGGDSTLDALIDSSEELLKQDPDKLVKEASEKNSPAQLSDDFSFSGYKKQRISVDFYKIDIHNVFRLFRQITNLNIIVDEDVSGSLTLALSDVPWDFALDIILNLMDLTKEEKFNTIVIYPKSKEFVWPTRADDNLAFTADTELIQQEALVIEQAERISPKIIESKKLIAKAQQFEKNEDFETAAQLYVNAMELWPDNAKLANRLTTLYLVNLGMNAKAVYYAKENLKRHPENNYAALYAAIGLANMQRISEAADYFAQSISGTPPMKEALLSYAAFSENNGQNDAALKLIDRYHATYGESVDTMISKARILDKIGLKSEAVKEYKAILASGYQIRPDLKKYIQGRLMIQ